MSLLPSTFWIWVRYILCLKKRNGWRRWTQEGKFNDTARRSHLRSLSIFLLVRSFIDKEDNLQKTQPRELAMNITLRPASSNQIMREQSVQLKSIRYKENEAKEQGNCIHITSKAVITYLHKAPRMLYSYHMLFPIFLLLGEKWITKPWRKFEMSPNWFAVLSSDPHE